MKKSKLHTVAFFLIKPAFSFIQMCAGFFLIHAFMDGSIVSLALASALIFFVPTTEPSPIEEPKKYKDRLTSLNESVLTLQTLLLVYLVTFNSHFVVALISIVATHLILSTVSDKLYYGSFGRSKTEHEESV